MLYDRGHQAGPLQFIKNDALLSFQAVVNIFFDFFRGVLGVICEKYDW